MAAAALLWPGPGAAPELPTTPLPPAIASPPVDVQVKPGYMSRTSAEGSARVFWTVPEDGSVKMTIEIPPDQAASKSGSH